MHFQHQKRRDDLRTSVVYLCQVYRESFRRTAVKMSAANFEEVVSAARVY